MTRTTPPRSPGHCHAVNDCNCCHRYSHAAAGERPGWLTDEQSDVASILSLRDVHLQT